MPTLAPGTRLGPYEIVAPLGAGGMGEVYRARDTRLGRDVAVKVLPQQFSEHAELRARFEREARTVSSLAHPNICVLHDVGREGTTDYLVMELVEGETLAQRLTKGPLPAADVLRVGRQIADALDRAHRAGVVHRDLKPANIMLTKRDAKLMDFGLARTSAFQAGAPLSGTHSPTVAAPLTTEGTLVGTFQYMAPEQLEGQEADARADLWAFGCVLHEMATGRRAFEGRSQASLISAILSSQPPAVSAIAPLSPPALDRLVTACLAKDPAERVQSAHDVKLQLEWMAEPGSQSGASPAAGPSAARTAGPRDWRVLLSLAFGAAGLAAAAFVALRPAPPPPSVALLDVPRPPDLIVAETASSSALSPDGRQVAARASRGSGPPMIWRWSLDSPEPVALAGTEEAYSLKWSPDSRSILYTHFASRGLFRVPAAGGTPLRVADAPDPRGCDWSPKDVIVFAPFSSGPLHRVPAGGGRAEPATALDASRGEVGHRFPNFLPDGEHFLFTVMPQGPRGYDIRLGRLGSTESRSLLHADGAAAYVAPGFLVYRQGGRIVAQRFDAGRLRLEGEPLAIADAPTLSDMTAEPVVTSAADGRMLTLSSPRIEARLEWWSRAGVRTGGVGVPAGDWMVRGLSPDQRQAVATSGGDLWLLDLERATTRRLMRGVEEDFGAAWSPDGRRVAATGRDDGAAVILVFDAGGSGRVDTLRSLEALFLEPRDWSPDGGTLLVAALGTAEAKETGWDLWNVPLDGRAPARYAGTEDTERGGRISPDGRWAVCVAFTEGDDEVTLVSYPEPARRVPVPSGGWRETAASRVHWSANGREVLLLDAEQVLWTLPVLGEGEDLRVGAAARLLRLPESGTSMATRDGSRFLVSVPVGASPGPSLRLISGWTALLKR